MWTRICDGCDRDLRDDPWAVNAQVEIGNGPVFELDLCVRCVERICGVNLIGRAVLHETAQQNHQIEAGFRNLLKKAKEEPCR